MKEYNPFSSLPDDCFKPESTHTIDEYSPFSTVKPLPASIMNAGNNGRNTPADLIESMERVLQKNRTGRMSLFSPERAAAVIEAIEDGSTMQKAAASIGVDRKTLWAWMQLSPDFCNAVAQAREIQGHASADDAIGILDDVKVDPENPKAAMAELRKAEQRARIRMELAKCFNFRQYGDKKQNMNLNVNAEVSPVDLSRYT